MRSLKDTQKPLVFLSQLTRHPTQRIVITVEGEEKSTLMPCQIYCRPVTRLPSLTLNSTESYTRPDALVSNRFNH